MMVRKFLTICKKINFPVAVEKIEWAQTRIIFLGVILDGHRHCLGLTLEKIGAALHQLNMMIDRKKATVKEIQHLAGTLNFFTKAIYPGRAFTRHMYSKYSEIKNGKGIPLKQFHHVNIDREFKNDCEVWRMFLQSQSAFSRPFIDFEVNEIHAEKLEFYTDASLSEVKGFGCVFGREYTFGAWEPNFIANHKPSIAFLELYALCVGIFTWQNKLNNCRIIVNCDNTSVRDMVNDLTSGCKNCMYLIRLLTLNNLKHNRRVFVVYIESK